MKKYRLTPPNCNIVTKIAFGRGYTLHRTSCYDIWLAVLFPSTTIFFLYDTQNKKKQYLQFTINFITEDPKLINDSSCLTKSSWCIQKTSGILLENIKTTTEHFLQLPDKAKYKTMCHCVGSCLVSNCTPASAKHLRFILLAGTLKINIATRASSI